MRKKLLNNSVLRCDFLAVFGGEIPQGEEIIDLTVREAVHSTQNLVALACLFISLLFLIRKCLKNSPSCLTKEADESIFYFLDFIEKKTEPVEGESVQKREINTNGPGQESRPGKEEETKSSLIFLFDFYKYCCSCCCLSWRELYKKISTEASRVLRRYSKKISYILLLCGYFYYYQIILLSPILLMSECVWNSSSSLFIFNIIDFTLGSLYFAALVFIFSFINSKKELLGLRHDKKYERGMIVYYHCKKSLLFGSIHACFKLVIIALFNDPLYENSTSNYNGLYWTLRNIFFLALIQYNDTFSQTPISRNDIVLKAQSRKYTYQNILLKYFPREELVYRLISRTARSFPNMSLQSEEFLLQSLREELSLSFEKLKKSWERELEIIEKQKFKRIVKNPGLSPLLQIFLYIYLCADCFFQIFIGLVTLLSRDDLPFYVFSQCLLMWLNIMEVAVMPTLIYCTLKRKTFFGEEEDIYDLDEEKAFDEYIRYQEELSAREAKEKSRISSKYSFNYVLDSSESSDLSEIFRNDRRK